MAHGFVRAHNGTIATNETGRNDAAPGVDYAFSVCVVRVAEGRDPASADRQVGHVPGIASVVDDVAVDDDDLVLRLLTSL